MSDWRKYCGNENCRREKNFAGLCTVCDPEATEKYLEELVWHAIRLCNVHGWSYGGPGTLKALSEEIVEIQERAVRQ